MSAKRKTRLGEWHYVCPEREPLGLGLGVVESAELLFAKEDQLRLRVGFDDPSLASHWAIMSATKEDLFIINQPSLGE